MESLNESDFVYFKNAMDGLATAQSVVAFVQSVIVAKYKLKEGDQITPEGAIVRVGSYSGVDNEPATHESEPKESVQ